MRFYLQRLTTSGLDWYEPRDHIVRGKITMSERVSDLVKTIESIADTYPYTFSSLYRIVNEDGMPVVAYKVRAGRVKKLRRKR